MSDRTREGIDRTAARLARANGQSFEAARDRVVKAVVKSDQKRKGE